MFRGRFEHTIDSKGRVSIPAKFRELLAERYDDRVMITNFDRCLVAYPYEEWKAIEEKISSLSMVKKETKAFQRFFVSAAAECPIDKLGRVLIPPTLRSYAQLEKDVVFAGMIKKFEIWRRERFLEEIQKAEENFEGMAEPLASLGL
jgi:MraZ protein